MNLKHRLYLVLTLPLILFSSSVFAGGWTTYQQFISGSEEAKWNNCNSTGSNLVSSSQFYTAYRCILNQQNRVTLQLWDTRIGTGGDTPCDVGEWNQSTQQCELPPEPEQCPEKGTKTDKTYEITLPWDGNFCLPVYINGCPYDPCGRDTSVPLDSSGNNCESFADSPDLLTCYFKPEAIGPVEPCTGDNCPESPPAVDEPKSVGTPETSTETKTDPSTGATTTTETERSTQVNPDGSSTETNTTTTVTTDSNGTTTTVRTDTTTRNPDGSTTTTTTEQVTGPDGVTKTTISGSTQQGERLDERGGSECDPESKDYLQCVGMLEEIGDSQSADLIAQIDQTGDDVIDNYQTGMDDLFSVMESPDEPSVLVDLVSNFIPSSSGCNDFGFTWNSHTFTVPCTRLEPLRQWFGWLLSVLSVISIFYIALRPQH